MEVYAGDGNDILLEEILPTVRYEDYRRALCSVTRGVPGQADFFPATGLAGFAR